MAPRAAARTPPPGSRRRRPGSAGSGAGRSWLPGSLLVWALAVGTFEDGGRVAGAGQRLPRAGRALEQVRDLGSEPIGLQRLGVEYLHAVPARPPPGAVELLRPREGARDEQRGGAAAEDL